jgi:hypothetical protein
MQHEFKRIAEQRIYEKVYSIIMKMNLIDIQFFVVLFMLSLLNGFFAHFVVNFLGWCGI